MGLVQVQDGLVLVARLVERRQVQQITVRAEDGVADDQFDRVVRRFGEEAADRAGITVALVNPDGSKTSNGRATARAAQDVPSPSYALSGLGGIPQGESVSCGPLTGSDPLWCSGRCPRSGETSGMELMRGGTTHAGCDALGQFRSRGRFGSAGTHRAPA